MLGYHEVRPSGFQTWPAQLLEHEAADPGAGVHRGEDEERLEHDGEVVPERHQALAERAAEDVGHADRERRRAAGAGEQGTLAHRRGEARSSAPA